MSFAFFFLFCSIPSPLCLLFSVCQGSGKTYSITGGADRYEDRGLIPRILSMIFAEKEARSSQYLYSVNLSYLEIYNDDGYDLLDADHETKELSQLPKVAMFEDDTGNIHMRNIHLLPASTIDEALNLLFLGDTNRVICSTPSNDNSTRSHCIFTIYVEAKEVGGSKIRRSKLHLVDLAGQKDEDTYKHRRHKVNGRYPFAIGAQCVLFW